MTKESYENLETSQEMTMAEQKKKIEEVGEKYDLEMVLLFGSRVKKNRFPVGESDVDIAYLPKRELSGKEIIDLNCDLIDVFHCDQVDMVNLKRANPLLRYEIAKKSELLFGKEMDYLEFKAFAFRDYVAHRDLFDLRDLLIEKRQKLMAQTLYGE